MVSKAHGDLGCRFRSIQNEGMVPQESGGSYMWEGKVDFAKRFSSTLPRARKHDICRKNQIQE